MKQNFLWKPFLRNLRIQLFCLLLAIGTYFFYRSSLKESVNYVIPIEIELPPDKILTYQGAKEVRLSLRGRQSMVEEIQAINLTATVNLISLESGDWSVAVQLNDEELRNRRLEFNLQPTSIDVSIEEKASKNISVSSNLTGLPATGYSLVNYTIKPRTVMISGPASIIDLLNMIRTTEVNIAGKTRSYSVASKLELPHPLLSVIPNQVNYQIQLKEQTGILTLSVPITMVNLSIRLELSALVPLVAGVTLQGSQLALASLGNGLQDEVKVTADAKGINSSGRYILPLTALSPTDFVIVKVEPETVILTVLEQEQRRLFLPTTEGEANPNVPILPGPLGGR